MRTARLLVVALALGSLLGPAAPARAGFDLDVGPFAGLGAWVDVFDYAPAFLQTPGPPDITADTIDDLAALGVDTLYLQAGIDDARSEGYIADRERVGAILRRAHDNDVQVVAWYYPQLVDPARDLAHLRAIVDFRARGQRFDAIALDIESTQVPDVVDRGKRVVRLARHLREEVGDNQPVGAIVYPTVQLEVLNQTLWPNFPYKRLADHVDVWLPMVYWTFRDPPHRDPSRYTKESVRRLRENLDDDEAQVHPIGGLAEASTSADYEAFVRAAGAIDAVGWSIYDADTTFTPGWAYLRDERLPARP